jgi:predicted transcriptional regulator
MRRAETRARYKISPSQTTILHALLKYRFLTTDLLAKLLKKDRSTIYERLAVLVDQAYVVKKYDSSYRINRRSASYYLAPAGIRYLKSLGVERTQIHYKNKDLTEAQIDEYYRYPKFSLSIHHNYPQTFRTYSKYQLNPEDYLNPMPWLLFAPDKEDAPELFLEYIPAGEQSWIIRKRINQHIDYADEEADYRYPYLLLVAGNNNTEKRIIKMSSGLIWDSELYTTTEERLLSGKKNIWLRPIEVDWDEELMYHGLPLELVDDD